MATDTLSRDIPALGAPGAGRPADPPVADGTGDSWPRTNRVLPWMIVAFVAMLWLLPFDSIRARAGGPVDLYIDRLFLSVMILVWLSSVFAGGRRAPRWHRGPVDAALLLFVAIAVASVVLNVGTLVVQGETNLALKKIGLLLSYVTFFYIAATTIRREELSRFLALFVGLAVVTGIGVLYQYWGGENLFLRWGDALFPDALFATTVTPAQDAVTGPAGHGLALAAMFALAFAASATFLLRAQTTRERFFYGLVTGVILLGVFATSRKTGSFATIGAAAALVAYRRKEFSRYIIPAAAAFVALLVIAPNAVDKQIEQVRPGKVATDASGKARTADYESAVPDVRRYLVTGRGYGTYDRKKYRYLDNHWLMLLLETGLLGVAAFAFLILAVFGTAHRLSRDHDLRRAAPALAATGAAVAMAICMALFDALAFPQVPYMFLFLTALVVVARSPERDETAPAAAPAAATTEAPTQPLPPLRDRLELPVRRDPHAPAFGRGLSRRPGEAGHASPLEPSHAGDSAHDGARRRIGVASRIDRAKARNGVVALVLVGFVVALFGGGGEPRGLDGSELGAPSGDDPFGLDQYARAQGAEGSDVAGKGTPDGPADPGDPADDSSAIAPTLVADSGPTPGEARQVVLGTEREQPADRRNEDVRDERQQPEDRTPPPNEPDEEGQPDEQEPQPEPGPDGSGDPGSAPPSEREPCLPVEGADEIFIEVLGQDPCGNEPFSKEIVAKIQKAAAAGTLDAADVKTLEATHAKLAAKKGGSEVLSGFVLLLAGGAFVRRRRR